MAKKCLIIIDPQNDFCDVNGSLKVEGASERMHALADYIKQHKDEYGCVVVTCDFHPFNHCSFIGNDNANGEKGQWPPHCIEHSWGAAIYQPIMDALIEVSKAKEKIIEFIRKGRLPHLEEYSGFSIAYNINMLGTILALSETEGIIDVVGVAGDYCVLQSVKSLCEDEFKDRIHVLTEFCPSIDDGFTLNNFLTENNISHT